MICRGQGVRDDGSTVYYRGTTSTLKKSEKALGDGDNNKTRMDPSPGTLAPLNTILTTQRGVRARLLLQLPHCLSLPASTTQQY